MTAARQARDPDVAEHAVGDCGVYEHGRRRSGRIISGYAMRRGRPLPVNDTRIAACCLTYGLPLATLNTTDFEDFAAHEGLELVTSRARSRHTRGSNYLFDDLRFTQHLCVKYSRSWRFPDIDGFLGKPYI